MDPTGNEQRVQALFLELKAKDEQLVPPFGVVWKRAQQQRAPAVPPLRLSLVSAIGLLLLALGSLTLWSRSWQPKEQLASQPATPASGASQQQTLAVNIARKNDVNNQTQGNRHGRRLASHRRAQPLTRQQVISNAMAIAVWQSPTTALLGSPAEDVLSSLPQLTESAVELRSFLPRPDLEENQ